MLLPILSKLVALILLTVAAVWLAKMTWLVLTPKPQMNVGSVEGNQGRITGSERVDVSRIQQLHLFGETGVQSVQQTIDAPETTLNVRLVGVTASNNPALSAAIIQQGSNQNTYIPGDTIEGSRAELREIYGDRVLLDNSGRVETLWLDGRDGREASLNLTSTGSSASSSNTETSNTSEDVELSSQQQELLEVISIQPERNGSELLGYRVSPKNDPAKFSELGFETGDIAVAINGYDLTNMVEAMELMNEIQGMTQAQVSVLRNGEIVDIDIYLASE